jgi:hypothetical protein
MHAVADLQMYRPGRRSVFRANPRIVDCQLIVYAHEQVDRPRIFALRRQIVLISFDALQSHLINRA